MTDLLNKVEKALDTIRPYLEADGGNVKVLEIDNGKNVILELMGNCGSCPMSVMTLKAGVEEAVKREVPEINSVNAVNITSTDTPDSKRPFST